jgi:hypothetical protein
MTSLINALIGGNGQSTSLLTDFKTADNLVGYNIAILSDCSINWTEGSPISLLHYFVLYACVNESYKKLLKYILKKNPIDFSAPPVDINGKGVDQYILALSMHKPEHSKSCSEVLQFLCDNGLTFQPDNNGVSVALCSQTGAGFNKSEFITKYNQAGGKSSNVITGMRQMVFRHDASDNIIDYDSDIEGGKFTNDHDNAVNMIASKLGLKTTDLRVRAVKSLLYDKVKADYPDLHGKDRTAKLEDYVSNMDQLSESAISQRMQIIADIDKNRPDKQDKPNKPSNDKPVSKSKPAKKTSAKKATKKK